MVKVKVRLIGSYPFCVSQRTFVFDASNTSFKTFIEEVDKKRGLRLKDLIAADKGSAWVIKLMLNNKVLNLNNLSKVNLREGDEITLVLIFPIAGG
ncbi:MAG: hypothetical protein QXJ17_08915 [Nitrososphaeria archaeon]